MTMLGPSVDEATASENAEYAAVPVPVLYRAAQAAMDAGAWAEACELLREVVRLEPRFGQDGVAARELLTRARREHARATRRASIVGPWPLLLSAAVLILVPLAAGLATGTFQLSLPTIDQAPPTVVAAVPTAVVVEPTLEPTAAPLVGVLPLVR